MCLAGLDDHNVGPDRRRLIIACLRCRGGVRDGWEFWSGG